jgi:hypothetical protein
MTETYGTFHASETIIYQSIESDTWNIVHNLGYSGVIYNVFNSDNERIIPSSSKIIDENDLILTFDENVSGYVIMTTVGSVLFKNILKNSSFIVSSEQDDLDTISYSNTITELIDNGEYYYVRMDIPKTLNDIKIKSIGIINTNNETIFYSECSEIYKKDQVTMTIFYKIKKEKI